MRSVVVAAVVLAAMSFHADAAAKKHVTHAVHHAGVHHAGSPCYSQADIEAEQAIRFQTDVMVVSSVCKDTTYAEFRLRNRDAIIHYQHEMIAHFHGQRAFDTWSTALANEASRKQSGTSTAQICQQSAPMMKQASTLDARGLHAYAAARAATVAANYTKCTK